MIKKHEVKLNIGCGNDIRNGWENYDKYPENKDVKKLDLDKLPLPFKDSYADYILLSHVYEHLNVNRYDFMREIHRILKVGCIVEIRCPSFNPAVDHTLWFIPLGHFNSLCRVSKNIEYTDFIFSKVEAYRHNTDKFGFLFKFPIIEKLFPHLASGECIWKLQKIKNEKK